MRDLPNLKLPDVGEAAVAVEAPDVDQSRRARLMETTCSYMPRYGSCGASLTYQNMMMGAPPDWFTMHALGALSGRFPR